MRIASRSRTSHRSRAKRSRGAAPGRLAAALSVVYRCSAQMAKYDPDQALQLAQAAESPAQRAQAMGKVLAAIAQTNPSMAMVAAAEAAAGEMRSEILGEVATERRDADAHRCARLAQRHQRQVDAQLEAAQSLGCALARRDVEAAADMIDRVPKDARAQLDHVGRAGLCGRWIREGPAVGPQLRQRGARPRFSSRAWSLRAIPSIAVQLVDGRERRPGARPAVRGLLPPLAEHSPALAARWAERVTDDRARSRSIGEVAGIWAQYDLPAARKWILSLDDGPSKDAGTHSPGPAARVDPSTTCCRSSTRSRLPSDARTQC